MSSDNKNKSRICPECGAEAEADARYCTRCSATLEGGKKKRRKLKRKIPREPVKPWAIKAGTRIKNMPRKVKIGVPVAVLVIVAIIVALSVLASTHSPASTVARYLSLLKQGNWKGAHELIEQTGRFSTLSYFEDWQNSQAEKLGRLQDYKVLPSSGENRLFGHIIVEEQPTGTPFVATLVFKDKSYDVDIFVEEAGGVWPFKSYRLRLSDQPTRVIASPQGAKVYIDGTLAGTAAMSKFLEDALSLGDLPSDFAGIVDYAKKLMGTVRGAVGEFRRLALDLSNISNDVQHVINRFGANGVSWSEFTDSLESTVASSKELWSDIARTAVSVYWIFGGGNDGSLRSKLTRTENVVDIKSLPEGFHEVRVVLPGLAPQTKEFYAPEDVVVELKPNTRTRDALKGTLQAFYRESAIAMFTGNTAGLPAVASGKLLEEENKKVADLVNRGLKVASDLTALEYEKIMMLSGDVGTVEVKETWNLTTYSGNAPASMLAGIKQHVTYTIQFKDGAWKATERKVD